MGVAARLSRRGRDKRKPHAHCPPAWYVVGASSRRCLRARAWGILVGVTSFPALQAAREARQTPLAAALGEALREYKQPGADLESTEHPGAEAMHRAIHTSLAPAARPWRARMGSRYPQCHPAPQRPRAAPRGRDWELPAGRNTACAPLRASSRGCAHDHGRRRARGDTEIKDGGLLAGPLPLRLANSSRGETPPWRRERRPRGAAPGSWRGHLSWVLAAAYAPPDARGGGHAMPNRPANYLATCLHMHGST